ncbi:hypothetical protein [Geminocystis sp. GBBB08]|nr:hypothetical protein [Geminocystis sp. GBBB08]
MDTYSESTIAHHGEENYQDEIARLTGKKERWKKSLERMVR